MCAFALGGVRRRGVWCTKQAGTAAFAQCGERGADGDRGTFGGTQPCGVLRRGPRRSCTVAPGRKMWRESCWCTTLRCAACKTATVIHLCAARRAKDTARRCRFLRSATLRRVMCGTGRDGRLCSVRRRRGFPLQGECRRAAVHVVSVSSPARGAVFLSRFQYNVCGLGVPPLPLPTRAGTFPTPVPSSFPRQLVCFTPPCCVLTERWHAGSTVRKPRVAVLRRCAAC